MKVTFDFTRDDIWNYGKNATFSVPKFRRKFIINVMTVPILVCAVGYTMGFNLGQYIAYGIGLTLFYIYVLKSVLKGKVVKANSGKGGPLGKHAVDVGINGIRENLPDREEYHSWIDIKKVMEDKKYIYIYWSSIAAHVIPKRAFSKKEDGEFFFTTVMNHWEKTKTKIISK